MGILRVLLALFVLIAHVNAPAWLKVASGAQAVQLFYINSGFYMTLVLSGKYRGAGGRMRFWLSRFFRLWLAYAAVLVLTLLISVTLPRITGRHSEMSLGWESDGASLNGWWRTVFAVSNGSLWLQDLTHFVAIDPITQQSGGGT